MSFIKSLNKKLGSKGRALLLLVAGVLVLVGVLFMLLHTDAKPETGQSEEITASAPLEQEGKIIFINRAPADVLSMHIKNHSTEVTLVKREEGSYFLEEHPNIPLKDDYLNYTWEKAYLFGADTLIDVEQTEANDTLYGFDNPAASVTVSYKDGKTAHFEMGKEVAGEEAGVYYIKAEGYPHYYEGAIHATFFNTLEAFCSEELLVSVEAAEVSNVSISGLGLDEALIVSENPAKEDIAADTYSLPYVVKQGTTSYGGNTEECGNLFYQLKEIEANSAVLISPSDKDKTAYGLLPPKGVVTFDYKTAGVKSTHKIQIGNTADGFAYILFDEVDVIYRIAVSNLYSSINASLDLLRTPLIFPRQVTGVKALTVSYEGVSYRFELSRKAEGAAFYSYQALCNGKVIDLEQYKDYFNDISASKAASFNGTAQKNAQPVLILKLEYFEDTGRKDEVISFTPSTAIRQLVCQLNGKGDFNLSEAVVNRIKSNAVRLSQNKAIIKY
ncbi:MAG: DUF4340 domain-containing protein [Oscillospiraceae bacterium]|jgi:hypothetical protein|nr:DUF4340 domain-containing protein [Oscillospiraceae bacterium]